ncbi:hypothetical protein Hypma_003691 [Hypsizygus marmoreus]|uniref:Prolyl 4-hydroxylase alpha subunit Fe(2+) 2OG dioxygenase domain-containing protein n=1 Tax=Hypsizygus marmoreus TaxID=39966 RepID=A0A369J2Z9_HYPMA|nr:hypothetical protein Hypma_003691 [Hypsizygus marmoreus]
MGRNTPKTPTVVDHDVSSLGNLKLRSVAAIYCSEEALSALAGACDQATFGRGDEDVLDETYRKAGKLDLEHFASTFDLGKSGLLEIVRSELLEGEDAKRALIYAELYKLNVYDKGAFFKAHKDTPRGETMFGSLVVVFPTCHEGGMLLLRHGGKEWAFNAAAEIFQQDIPVVIYVAFYSDVEHEVPPVTPGHRATLTYNLYFVLRSDADAILFPWDCRESAGRNVADGLEQTIQVLKGSDAMIFHEKGYIHFMLDRPVGFGTVYDDLAEAMEYAGAEATYMPGDPDGKVENTIHWVSDITPFNDVESRYLAMGNEASMETAYGSICLIVDVGKHGERATMGLEA